MKDLKRKLCSRKLWISIIGFCVAVGSALGLPDIDSEGVALIASGCAALSAYVIGEGIADGLGKGSQNDSK